MRRDAPRRVALCTLTNLSRARESPSELLLASYTDVRFFFFSNNVYKYFKYTHPKLCESGDIKTLFLLYAGLVCGTNFIWWRLLFWTLYLFWYTQFCLSRSLSKKKKIIIILFIRDTWIYNAEVYAEEFCRGRNIFENFTVNICIPDVCQTACVLDVGLSVVFTKIGTGLFPREERNES